MPAATQNKEEFSPEDIFIHRLMTYTQAAPASNLLHDLVRAGQNRSHLRHREIERVTVIGTARPRNGRSTCVRPTDFMGFG